MKYIKTIGLPLVVSLAVVLSYHFIIVESSDSARESDNRTPAPASVPASSADITKHPEFIRMRQRLHRLEMQLNNRNAVVRREASSSSSSQQQRLPTQRVRALEPDDGPGDLNQPSKQVN